MKIKIIFLTFLIGVFIVPQKLLCEEFTNCECGEHSTGITTYTVTGLDADCCEAPIAPDTVGYELSYTQQTNGVWQLTGQNQITGLAAKNKCCSPT